jgi:Fic family protein
MSMENINIDEAYKYLSPTQNKPVQNSEKIEKNSEGKSDTTAKESTSTSEEYATSGPLTRLFKNPTARILDQSLLVGQMEQTIAMLMESTNLSYKTVEKTIKELVKIGYVKPGRKVGNAQTYVFRVDNHLSGLITCARNMQMEYLRKEAE